LNGRTRNSSSVFPTLIALGCLVLAATCGARTPLDTPVEPRGAAGKPGSTGRAGTGGRAGSGGGAGAGGIPGIAGMGGAAGAGGASGVAGAGGVSGVAGAGGVSGVAGAGGVSGVAGAGGMGGTGVVAECPEGTARCASMTTIQLCQGGKWGAASNCSLICLGGICAECVPEQIQCAGPTSLRTCTNGGLWPDPVACPSGSCNEMENRCFVATDGGAPEAGGTCGDGTSECVGDQVRLCLGGTWGMPFACEHGCIGGVCAECRPGQTRCAGAQVCTAAGVWAGTPCPDG
jgi:hypothetical protein